MMKTTCLFVCFLLTSSRLLAQEDLLKELEENQPAQTHPTLQTFKGTRLINGHTVETKSGGDLEFIFAHRFGAINNGLFDFFGLDEAYVRLGLDYGIAENLSVSIGRNSVDKTVDGYLKYRIVRQSKGLKNFPVTITALGGSAYKVSPHKDEVPQGFTNIDRLAYVTQILIARKVNPELSLQFMPTFIHKNAVDRSMEKNDQFAVGFGLRQKLMRSLALTGEYYYRVGVLDANPSFNTLGFGVEIDTGGHVFQILFTNTMGLTERAFITETEGDFGDGDIHFGFNVTRTFQFGQKK